jgi:hypothetical protein
LGGACVLRWRHGSSLASPGVRHMGEQRRTIVADKLTWR